MNNIAKGFSRNSDKEFKQFLNISKGSGGEVKSIYYVADTTDVRFSRQMAYLLALRVLQVATMTNLVILSRLGTRESGGVQQKSLILTLQCTVRYFPLMEL